MSVKVAVAETTLGAFIGIVTFAVAVDADDVPASVALALDADPAYPRTDTVTTVPTGTFAASSAMATGFVVVPGSVMSGVEYEACGTVGVATPPIEAIRNVGPLGNVTYPGIELVIAAGATPAKLKAPRLRESLRDISLASVIEPSQPGNSLRELVRMGIVAEVAVPNGAVEAAIRFITKNYGKRSITVTDVAVAVSLSEHRLAHIFRNVTGLSVKDYILRFRVAVGRRLLAETNEKIETISDRLGFADASNFSRTFKAIDGWPPGEFRRSQS